MEILARFTHDHVDHTQDSSIHLVVSLKAPTLDWMQKRPKLCVLPVVDLSGSMEGEKLRYAKQSLLKLIDQLADGDFAGLIAFESRTHVLVKPQQVTSDLKNRLKNAINKLHIMGGTNFADGMLQSVKAVQQLDLPDTFLKRVIMFTDGQPTEGITNLPAILKMLDSNRGSVTVSAFGYGNIGGGTYGGVDQDFLLSFAELGKGNYAYVKNPDDALGAFGKELGGLLSTYATDLEVEVEPVNGHQVTKVVSNIEHTEDKVTGEIEIPFPEILSEETRHMVFQTKLLKQAKVFPRETTAFNVKLTYSVLTESGTKETRTVEEKARVRFVKPADAQKAPNAEVDEIASLHQVIRAQLEAEAEAKKGNFAAAEAHMNNVAQEVKTRGGVRARHLVAAAQKVGNRLGSQHAYVENQGYLRSFAAAGTRAYGTSAVDAEAQADLVECNVSLSNSSQAQYADAFTGRVVPPAPIAGAGILINPVGEINLGLGPQTPVTPDLAALFAAADQTNKSG